MLVDVDAPIMTLRGKKAEPVIESGVPHTVGTLIYSVIALTPPMVPLSATERRRRHAIAVRIAQEKSPIEIDELDIKMIVTAIENSQVAALFAEQAILALEGKENTLATKAPPFLSVVT